MPVVRMSETDYEVVLGPCPGCECWQVDYTQDVAAAMGLEPFREAVEFLLQEHLDECPHLQLVLQDA